MKKLKKEESKGHVNPNYITEWKTARNLLTKFDDHLYDLRKYGFTFITALLTAQAFLLPHFFSTDPNTGAATFVNFPDAIKFAILLVNLLLIIALTVIDRNFFIIQLSAASRARVLERILDLELTEIITQRFENNRAEDWFTGLYCFFSVIVMILGIFVLYPNILVIGLLTIAGVIVILVIWYLRNYINLDWPYGPADYTIDGGRYLLGECVEITVTNLGEKDIKADKGDVIWQIVNQNNDVVFNEKAGDDFKIPKGDSYTRFWPTNSNTDPKIKIEQGIYSLYRAKVNKKKYVIINTGKIAEDLIPVPRKIRVYKKNLSIKSPE